MAVSRGAERLLWATGCVVAAAIAATASYATVNAHSSDALLVPPGSERLSRCPVPADPVPVESLGQDERLHGCDPTGLRLLFPDGNVLPVPPVGSVRFDRNAPGGAAFRSTNWGVPGVGVVWSTATGTQVWGSTPDAAERELRAWAYDLEHPHS